MRDGRRFRTCTPLLWGVLLGLAGPASLAAQAIRTRLIGARLRQPVAGALVTVIDSAGRELGRTLTDESGTIRFDVGPGSYRLRVLRIGFPRWETPLLRLEPGDTLTESLEPPEMPIELAGITVRGERRCQVRPEEGSAAATLWEEARKALEATQWTIAQRVYRFRTVWYVRSYAPSGNEPVDEQRVEKTGYSSWPFTSLAPESLAARGFVQPDSEGVMHYFGPDLVVLFSDVFLSQHCFRVAAAADSTAQRLIGLAFEPVSGRPVTDIAGALWLDRRTAALEALEFRYTRLGPWVGRGATGRIVFEQLPSGAWVIRQWFIRAPIPRLGRRTGIVGGMITTAPLDTIGVGGYREEGARVTAVLTAAGRPVAMYPDAPD